MRAGLQVPILLDQVTDDRGLSMSVRMWIKAVILTLIIVGAMTGARWVIDHAARPCPVTTCTP